MSSYIFIFSFYMLFLVSASLANVLIAGVAFRISIPKWEFLNGNLMQGCKRLALWSSRKLGDPTACFTEMSAEGL
jgi:hypothetical protein